MTPASRLATAIDLLDRILGGEQAGVVLTQWGRKSRFAGSKDRAAVRDIVFDCLRRKRSFAFQAGGAETGRNLVLSYVRHHGDDPADFFTGQGYNPASLSAQETEPAKDLDTAPISVRLDFPDFLEPAFRRSLAEDFEGVMAAMQNRAPVDLRVNRSRGTREAAQAALGAEDIETHLIDGVATGLRVVTNQRRVSQSEAFRTGLVELQDASSQAVALFADIRPDTRVLDYCAGGGGKALALYDMAGGKAQVSAHDIAAMRMNDLPARAARAGARIRVLSPQDPRLEKETFDTVFVDAPCSGTGSWRRTPDAKWRVTEEILDRLEQVQQDILEKAARLVSPGGHLIYATCSLLDRENKDQVDKFLTSNDQFKAIDSLRLTPLNCSDGFFGAKIERIN